MQSKKPFSIIELMTVVLIILLLISLLIPTFSKLKMNARNALCKNQLRGLGILFNSYTTEHAGYLPNDLVNDIPAPGVGNNAYYYGWTGHLLPYLETGLKSYNRTSKLRKDGEVYTYDYVGGKYSGVNPPDPHIGGWIVIKEAYEKGGFHELKTFICPENHANTYDVGVSNDFNGLKIPRITQMSIWLGFPDLSYNYLGGSLPTTYLANDVFFGADLNSNRIIPSLRMDEINSVSKKAFLVEGGLGWAKGTNGEPEYIYYRILKGALGANGITKAGTGGHIYNYVHDIKEKFWLMNCQLYQYFPSYWMAWDAKREIATKFNNTFAGQAMMVEGEYGYSIVSFIDPNDKPFDSFFLANPPGVPLLPFELYDEPEFHYLTGDMNVLFGDGSVVTKDQSWLSMNRKLIGQLSQE